MPKVLVTDASNRAALAVIRSLGMKGIDVTAGDKTAFNAGFLSKYCRHKILYPSPQRNVQEFLDYMLKLVKKEKYDLLIPITDFTTIPLSKHKKKFDPYVTVAVPSYDTMVKTSDKTLTIKIAAKHGIPYPKTIFVESVKDVEAIAKEIEYPAVIKPRTKVIWANNSAIMMKVTQKNYAYNPNDLITKYKNIILQNKVLTQRSYLPIIQEYVQGTGYGVEALFHNSELKAIFSHKRLREYPITGGASTLRVSVNNKKLNNLAVKLLKAMNWQGVAMVEFKLNGQGEPKLIEVNGRFWGSLPLAIASGVDFPFLLYKSMVEGGDFSSPKYKVGVKHRWLIPGDILWLYSSMISKRKTLGSIRDFVAAFGVADDIITLDDLRPLFGHLIETLSLFGDVLRGRRNLAGELLR